MANKIKYFVMLIRLLLPINCHAVCRVTKLQYYLVQNKEFIYNYNNNTITVINILFIKDYLFIFLYKINKTKGMFKKSLTDSF